MNIKTITTCLFFIIGESCHVYGSFSHTPKRILLTAIRSLHSEKNIITQIESLTLKAQESRKNLISREDVLELVDLEIPTKNISFKQKKPSSMAKFIGLDHMAEQLEVVCKQTPTKQDLIDIFNKSNHQDNNHESK